MRVEPALHEDFENGMDHTFFVAYYANTQHHSLVSGVPTHGFIKAGSQYRYYTFFVSSTPEKLRFMLTTISGDADLVVSFSPNNQFPTSDKNDKKSGRLGNDVIELSAEDLKKISPTFGTSNGRKGFFSQIYVGVYSHDVSKSARYTLNVVEENGVSLPMQLTNGIP